MTTHDVILLYGQSDLHVQLLKELRTVNCSVLYIESFVTRESAEWPNRNRFPESRLLSRVLQQAQADQIEHDLRDGA